MVSVSRSGAASSLSAVAPCAAFQSALLITQTLPGIAVAPVVSQNDPVFGPIPVDAPNAVSYAPAASARCAVTCTCVQSSANLTAPHAFFASHHGQFPPRCCSAGVRYTRP